MSTHKFDLTVRSYSTVQFELDLDEDTQEIIKFYMENAEEPNYNDLRKLLPYDIQHDISVAAKKAEPAGFEHHEIAGNFDFEVNKIR